MNATWEKIGISAAGRPFALLSPEVIQVYAALKSGDIELEAMLEFVLQFAVYCGWPKASHLEMVIARQWARVEQEAGRRVAKWPELSNDTLGPNDWTERIEQGIEEFVSVNLVPAPAPETPYRHAGILNFVFGHVWQRPGLTRRERRIITVASVALDDSPIPLRTHVRSAILSGDITKEEMDQIVLQFSAYYGFAKGEALSGVVEDAWSEKRSTDG
jgi:4-carboxymuconolactone decarboxylase